MVATPVAAAEIDVASSTSTSSLSSPSSFEIWRLPDEVVYHISCYVAARTQRAHVLVFQLALLNQSMCSAVCQSTTLWNCVLHGEYATTTSAAATGTAHQQHGGGGGGMKEDSDEQKLRKRSSSSSMPLLKKRKTTTTPPKHQQQRKQQNTSSSRNTYNTRSSLRLQLQPMERVREAHQFMLAHTELAYSYLCDATSSSSSSSSNHHRTLSSSSRWSLNKPKLVRILDEYGPCLQYQRVMSTGGTFLVEICRAKQTTPAIVLACVKELVERRCGGGGTGKNVVDGDENENDDGSIRNAMIQARTNESPTSQLTALCVCAVRGMPRVVQYLLQHGANPNTRCSGRFQCHFQQQQNISSSSSSKKKVLKYRVVHPH